MEVYKEFKNCKYHLGEKVRIITKEEIENLQRKYHTSFGYMEIIASSVGTIVDKLSSGYILSMDIDRLNTYYCPFSTKRMGKRKIFGNTVSEKFILPYSKNKRLI